MWAFQFAGDAPLKIKIDAESGFAWQRSHWVLDGVLKLLSEKDVDHPPIRNLAYTKSTAAKANNDIS